MPAKDHCEPQVIEAFEKAGWVLTDQPFAIRVDKKSPDYIFADLRFRQSQNDDEIIVVEVKCFANYQSQLEEFYRASGQYVIYRNALALNDTLLPIYLVVPTSAFETFIQTPLIHASIQDIRMKLVVVDLDKEEIIKWVS